MPDDAKKLHSVVEQKDTLGLVTFIEQNIRRHFEESLKSFEDGTYNNDAISLPDHPDLDDYTNAYLASDVLLDKLLGGCPQELRSEAIAMLSERFSPTKQPWLTRSYFVNPHAMRQRR